MVAGSPAHNEEPRCAGPGTRSRLSSCYRNSPQPLDLGCTTNQGRILCAAAHNNEGKLRHYGGKQVPHVVRHLLKQQVDLG